MQLASFGPDSPEAPEPEEPEERKERDGRGRTAGSRHRICRRRALQRQTSPREIGPDSAAAPISPPASDRNATTSAQVKTSAAPQSPAALDPSLNPKPLPRSPNSPRKTISVRKEPRRSTPPPWLSARSPAPSDVPRHDPNPQPPQRRPIHGPSAPQSLLSRFAVRNILDTLRATAGPNRRRATRLHTLPGRSRRDRLDQHHASADDKRRGLAGRAPGQADHFHRRTHAAAA